MKTSLRVPSGIGVLLGLAAVVAILGPLGFLAWKGLIEEGIAPLSRLAGQINLLLVVGQVTLLATLTTLWAMVFGVPLAFVTTRTDLPFRDVIRWLAPLPLAIPPYIGALVYQILVGRPMYGLWGAAFVLGLFTYPYVYLLVSGALERSNPALEEAARAAGLGPRQIAYRVTLPLLRPALLASGLMVFLYGWADFGVVSLLRVRTLTTIIYDYVQGTMDWALPAGLSVLLSGITMLILFFQVSALGQGAYTQISSATRPSRPLPLGRWRALSLGYTAFVLALALILPLGVLIGQAARLGSGAIGIFLADQSPYVLNSLWTAMAGATLALLTALAVAWLEERGKQGWGIFHLFQVGYAIPGTVLGLGMLGFFHATVPGLYATPLILVLGYLILYITPACQATRAALAQLHPSLEEVARGLGKRPVPIFFRITLPLIRPGLISGWLLVFILSARELAATLILRPAGFDTVPVRIWIYTMDVGPEPRAAILALALVALIALPWLIFLTSQTRTRFTW